MGVEIGRDRDRLDNEGVMPRRGMGVEMASQRDRAVQKCHAL